MLLQIQSLKRMEVTTRATRNILREYFLGRGHLPRARRITMERQVTPYSGVGADPVCKAEADVKATVPESMPMIVYRW